MGELYTIGHSTLSTERFIDLLRYADVNYVLDVRSIPFSQYAPQFNSSMIKSVLEKCGIRYAKMGKYFGARQDDLSYYPNGYLDFERFRASALFRKGKENVLKGLEENNIALMCTEKDPINCHRAIMVARDFALSGTRVMHILHDRSLLDQHGLDRLLLDKYYPDRKQISMFNDENMSDEDYLIEAYARRNAEIGYRPIFEKKEG